MADYPLAFYALAHLGLIGNREDVIENLPLGKQGTLASTFDVPAEKLLASRKRWLLAELAKCEIVSLKNFGGALLHMIGIYFEYFFGQVDHVDSERIISPYERGSNVHQEVKNLRLLRSW